MSKMARLIDVDVLLGELQEELEFESLMYTNKQNEWINKGLKIAVKDVKRQPTVDAVKVVHGEWLDGSGMARDGSITYTSIDCSVCEEIFKIESHDREYWKGRFKTCPFCSAKMDGGPK